MLLVLIVCASFRTHDDVLVHRLGSEDFRTRADAEVTLRERGTQARIALLRGMQHEDAEVRYRCATIHAFTQEKYARECLASLSDLPMIDALWYDEDNGSYLSCLYPEEYVANYPYLAARCNERHTYVTSTVPAYREYYLATEDMLLDRFRAGATVESVQPMLDEMRRRDAIFYWRAFGDPARWHYYPAMNPGN